MKRLTTVCTLLLLSTVIGACGGDPDTADETPTQETRESAANSGSHMGLINPNLASEQELLALEGLSEGAVSAIAGARPFFDMVSLDNTLDRLLESEMRATLYEHAWIPLNLNAASEEEMLLIPGVGDRMAHEFDEYRPYDGMERFRREIGKYVDTDELERLAQYVFVPVELNTASDEEILHIPGVGDRMLHEFKEYRPYASMEQFKREIGKYVDDSELARLSRYVTLAEN